MYFVFYMCILFIGNTFKMSKGQKNMNVFGFHAQKSHCSIQRAYGTLKQNLVNFLESSISIALKGTEDAIL